MTLRLFRCELSYKIGRLLGAPFHPGALQALLATLVPYMSFRHGKGKLLIVFALLAFAGQTLAAGAMHFAMTDSTPGKTAVMSDHGIHHGHSMHNTTTADDSSAADAECCQNSHCPMSSCASAGIMPSSPVASAMRFASTSIQFSGHSFASAAITSLYRPPISR